jgi:rubrerythrin
MLSRTPVELTRIGKKELDMEILRTAIMAELDAINLYEQLAAQTEDANVRKVLLEEAQEEKTHVGEFQEMLLRMDKEQVRELDKAKEEVKQLTGE